jgi:hypothetical protein
VDTHFGVPVTGDEPLEVIRYWDLWRKIAGAAGDTSYDQADWQGDRLYFRSDYSEKVKKWPPWAEFGDWGAWILAPGSKGNIAVLSSLKHEREAQRTERIEVMFSRFSDAGKYVILRIGDGIRSSRDLRLKTLFVNWETRGLDPRIRVKPASREVVDFFNAERPTLKDGLAKKHLKSYTLDDDPGSYGYALDSEQPRMEVLALSFDELTAALLEDMPDSITSQVSRWRQ